MIRFLPVLVCIFLTHTAALAQRTFPITTFSIGSLQQDVESVPLPSAVRGQVRGLLEEARRAGDRGSARTALGFLGEFASLMRAQPAGVIPVARASDLARRADSIMAALDQGIGLGGAEVGPEGGVLEVVDVNSPLFRARLEIPPGALGQPTVVSISADGNRPGNRVLMLSGAGISLAPRGLALAVPATLSLPYLDMDRDARVDDTGVQLETLRVGVLDRAGRMAFPRRTLDTAEQVQRIEIYELGSFWNVSWQWGPGVLTYTMAWPVGGVAVSAGSDLSSLADAVRNAVGTWAAALGPLGVRFEEVAPGQPAAIRFGFFSTSTPLSVLSSPVPGPSGLVPGLGRGLGDGAAQVYASADPLAAGEGFAIMFNSDFGQATGSLAWTPDHSGDTNSVAIEAVALHALGHVVGLEDLPGLVQPPVMATGANLRRPVVCLALEDVRALGRLYGTGDDAPLPACAHAVLEGLPPSFDFGSVASGSAESVAFTVTNSGSGDLIIGSIETGGPFRLTTADQPMRVLPGESFAFEVAFAGDDPGPADGEVRVLSNTADGSGVLSLTAQVPYLPPECTLGVRPERLTVGESATLFWTVGGSPSSAVVSGIGAVAEQSGSVEVAPSDSTPYVLTVSNPAGAVTCETRVEVSRAISSEVVWTRSVGTAGEDSVRTTLGGEFGLLVGGEAGGTAELLGEAFVALYDIAGEPVWERRFPGSRIEEVSVDESGIYAAGVTGEALVEGGWQGDFDVFLRKYDFDGDLLWTDQFGTFASDRASAVAVGPSGVYVTGVTGGSLDPSGASGALDVFVRKYSPDGEVIWTRQSGTSGDDIARDVAVVGEGFVLVGEVRAALAGQSFGGGSDAFLTYYDTAGDPVWTRQFGGAGSEFIAAVAADESGVYVAGGTETALSGQVSMGGFDAFLRKYDLLGAELWTRQFGTVLTESVSDVGVDATGVFLVGATEGTMAGQLSRGAFDAFVRAYDLDGGVVWTRYVGTSASDDAFSISPYHLAVYIGGSTLGAFDLPNSGATDGYFVKILK